MPQDSSRERRRHQRIAVDASVRLSTIDPEIDPHTGRPFFRAFEESCANLSRGGLSIHTEEALSPGRRVLIEVAVPEGRPVFEAVARIAWAGSFEDDPGRRGLGLEFVGGPPRPVDRFEQLLAAPPAP
jgi:Tfp pilus assembly protein PilZ